MSIVWFLYIFFPGFFHKKHVRASKGSISEEHTYICFGCRAKKPVEVKTKKPVKKVKTKKPVKVSSKREVQKVEPESYKIPKLRRSQRAIKKVTTYVPVQSKKINDCKKGSKFQSESDMPKTSKFPSKCWTLKKSRFQSKRERSRKSSGQTKSEMPKEFTNVIRWPKGKRTCVHHAYWLKGILWAKNPYDGRRNNFQDRNVLQSSNSEDKQPVCGLCHEAYESGLIYVRCESCEGILISFSKYISYLVFVFVKIFLQYACFVLNGCLLFFGQSGSSCS